MSVMLTHESGDKWSVAAQGLAVVSCDALQLRVSAAIEVGSLNGSSVWNLRPTELPPASTFPHFAMCVVRSTAVATGAHEALVSALHQLKVALISDGSVLGLGIGRQLLGSMAQKMGWGIGSMHPPISGQVQATTAALSPRLCLSAINYRF